MPPRLLFAVICLSAVCIAATAQGDVSPSGTIATLYIDTKDAAPITSKTVYVEATMSIANAGEHDTPQPLPLLIRGRGNSSWKGQKKPYKLTLESKAKLLGMKKERHWALINGNEWPRLCAGFQLGRLMGMAWTPDARPVEVVLNGAYQGLYLLIETVRTGKHRVAIAGQPDLCTNPDSIAGGWLVEVDNYADERQIIVTETNSFRMRVTWHTPEVLSAQQRAWLVEEFRQMNSDIYAPERDDQLLASHIDVMAMARFFVVQELLDNPDGFHGSFFLHKPYDPPSVWIAGPLWDLNCLEREKTDYTFRMKASYTFTPHLIGRLLDYGSFRDAVNRVWADFYPDKADEWMAFIDEACSPAVYGEADKANNKRWPSATYQGLAAKVERTRYWYAKNVEWFNNHLPTPTDRIQAPTASHAPRIFNLQGQRLDREPAKGVFIIDNKIRNKE